MILQFCILACKGLQCALRNCFFSLFGFKPSPPVPHSSHCSLVTVQREMKDSQSQEGNKQQQPPFAWPTLEAGLRSQCSHSCSFGKFLSSSFISYKGAILRACLR